MSAQGPEPTEDELRAAFEEQMRNITVDRVLIETAVTLVNLAGRKLGLGGSEAERDLPQVRDAIDAVRGLMPVLERQPDAPDMAPLRDALSQLQLEYAKVAGQPGQPGQAPGQAGQPGQAPAAPGPEPASKPAAEGEQPAEPGAGPAQSSGRLWVPGS
ncbi:MAG: hypothetical protein ACR2ND_01500 [Solirubrobacteraceae bacterium]